MRLTKYGHACVRLDHDDRAVVIDPGVYSEAESLTGATAVLITHEHADHIDVDKLKAARADNPALTVHAPAALAATLGDDVIPVAVGDPFTAAGFTVRAVGGDHAEIIDGVPGCPNLGFVVDGVYHPGDSLFVPTETVDTLLVPASGPWLKLGEAIEFARAVGPARATPSTTPCSTTSAGTPSTGGWRRGAGPHTPASPWASRSTSSLVLRRSPDREDRAVAVDRSPIGTEAAMTASVRAGRDRTL